MSRRLRPCSRCARHVLTAEVSCPFCGTVLVPAAHDAAPSSPAPTTPTVTVGRRDALTRAALMASLLGALACGSESNEPSSADPPTDAGASTDARSDDDGSPRDAQAGVVDDAGSVIAMYGAPGCDVAALGGEPNGAAVALLAASAALVRRRRRPVSR